MYAIRSYYGCGAIGGMMAGLLSRAGHQVSLLRTDQEQVTLPIIP